MLHVIMRRKILTFQWEIVFIILFSSLDVIESEFCESFADVFFFNIYLTSLVLIKIHLNNSLTPDIFYHKGTFHSIKALWKPLYYLLVEC